MTHHTPEKIKAAIELLKDHNEWRRGAETPMTDPKELGAAIDMICALAAAVMEDRKNGFRMTHDAKTNMIYRRDASTGYSAFYSPQSAVAKFFEENE